MISLTDSQKKLLGILYDSYFAGFPGWMDKRQLIQQGLASNGDVDILKSLYLIEFDYYFVRITNSGIDVFESSLPPTMLNERESLRRRILEVLREHYAVEPQKKLHTSILAQRIGFSEDKPLQLLSIIDYLHGQGFVDVLRDTGPHWFVAISGTGLVAFQESIFDDSKAMSASYRLLYQSENELRKFIEEKLRSKFGDQWLDKGISSGIRKQIDSKYQHEKSLGWTLAKNDNVIEYLSFVNYKGIITGDNWNEVFKPVFKDASNISSVLDMLEELRNAVGHCRTFSAESYLRLEQYCSQLLNLIGKGSIS